MLLNNIKNTFVIISIATLLSGCGSDENSSHAPSTPDADIQIDDTDTTDTDTDTDTDTALFPYSGECETPQLLTNLAKVDSQVANGTYECMSSWFSPSKQQADQLFSETVMRKITQSLEKVINQYQGKEQQAQNIYYLAEFIKAAYKNRHDTYARDLAPFPNEMGLSIAHVAQLFLRSHYSLSEGQTQQQALGSMLIIVDSVRQLSVAAPDVFALLDTFTAERGESYYYRQAINNIFIAMAGHSQKEAFYDLIESDPIYINKLKSFILNNEWAIGTDSEALLGNAARELARLIKTDDEQTKQLMTQTLEELLQNYTLGGKSDRVWVGIAQMVSAYAPEQLNRLALDNSKERLKQRVVPFSYNCAGPAQILAQKMTNEQAQTSCQTLNDKEDDFHNVANTGHQPVSDDYSETVDVIVFNTKDDYSTYSSFLFGNTTNNGGQFLERTPSQQGNTPRFVAYQNGWDDNFSILNLEHEYVHYLDGRFNQYGDFHTTMREGSIVWWLEGFAEYMHYKENYFAALSLGKDKTYSLHEVFTTNYSDGLNRVYRWGYLGVRFMLEKHPQETTELLGYARSGEYKQWVARLNDFGPIYNQEFQLWLDEVTKDINDSDISKPKLQENPKLLALNSSVAVEGEKFSEKLFYIEVPNGLTNVDISISGNGDADLYACYDKICHYHDYEWTNFTQGSNERISIPKGGDGFVPAGSYYISISGRDAFDVELQASSH
ncbi:collagenase [Vibrio splendidus]